MHYSWFYLSCHASHIILCLVWMHTVESLKFVGINFHGFNIHFSELVHFCRFACTSYRNAQCIKTWVHNNSNDMDKQIDRWGIIHTNATKIEAPWFLMIPQHFHFFVVSNISFHLMKAISGMLCSITFSFSVGRCFFSLIWIIADCEELSTLHLLLMGYI